MRWEIEKESNNLTARPGEANWKSVNFWPNGSRKSKKRDGQPTKASILDDGCSEFGLFRPP
jgi:hypothetical protein